MKRTAILLTLLAGVTIGCNRGEITDTDVINAQAELLKDTNDEKQAVIDAVKAGEMTDDEASERFAEIDAAYELTMEAMRDARK